MPCTEFEVSSFTRSKDTACAIEWLGARGVCQTRAWIFVAFYPTPTKFGVDIVEWSLLNLFATWHEK